MIKKIMGMSAVILLCVQCIQARNLTVINLNGYGNDGAVTVAQLYKGATTTLGVINGERMYDDPVLEQKSWQVPNDAFTLQFSFYNPRLALLKQRAFFTFSVQKGEQDVIIHVEPSGAKRVR
jgi:hypothetical protein